MITVETKLRTLHGNPFRTLNEFFQSHQPGAQHFVLDSRAPRQLSTLGGIHFDIPADALPVPAFRMGTSGTIRLSIREMLRKQEMLLGGSTSSTRHHLLDSAGQFSIQAYANDEAVALKRPISFLLPISADQSITRSVYLFRKGTAATRSPDGRYGTDWFPVTDQALTLKTLGQQHYLLGQLPHTGTYALGAYLPRRHRAAMLSAHWSSSLPHLREVQGFLLLHRVNALTRLLSNGNKLTGFNLPAGSSGSLVVIGLQAQQLFLGTRFVYELQNSQEKISLYPVTEHDLIKKIRMLT